MLSLKVGSLFLVIDFSGEAASYESLGRSPRNLAGNESSAESAAQMRRLCFCLAGQTEIATLSSFAPSEGALAGWRIPQA
jgi:hypothetical protein